MLIKIRKLRFGLVKNNLKFFCEFLCTSAYKEERIKVENVVINYLKVGNGPHTVFCMPGALGSIWTDFKPQVELMNREKFTLLAWDPPGFGKSRPPEREFTSNFHERDAHCAYNFLRALNIPKVSLLGWSYGGHCSMILAATYPDAVNKLVVWGTNTFLLPHELESFKKMKDIRTWSTKMREPMIKLYGEELLVKNWTCWIDSIFNLNNTEDGHICSELLKNIHCPTFILHGEEDPIVDSVHASYLHKNIKGSRLHLYPKGKHNIHLAYTEDFNKRVEEFLLSPLSKT